MRVAWVHPSWRDLVIEHLAADRAARARFLSASEPDGVSLALAVGGGSTGQRRLPLLREDADWDLLTDRVAHLIGDGDTLALAQILTALEAAVADIDGLGPAREARALASYTLDRIRRDWDQSHRVLDVHLLETWLGVAQRLRGKPELPNVARTWGELLPARAPELEQPDLERFDRWLGLAGVLKRFAPTVLDELAFPRRYKDLLLDFWTLVRSAEPVTVAPETRETILTVMHRYVEVGLFTRFELDGVMAEWREDLEPLWPTAREPPRSARPLGAEAVADVARILDDL